MTGTSREYNDRESTAISTDHSFRIKYDIWVIISIILKQILYANNMMMRFIKIKIHEYTEKKCSLHYRMLY